MNKQKLIQLAVFSLVPFIVVFFVTLFIGRSTNKTVRNSVEFVPIEVIKYPALLSLKALATGEVVEVGTNSFKIKNGESIIDLKYEERGVTSFHLMPNGEEIPLSALKVGDKVSGGVMMLISKEKTVGLTNKSVGDIVAHYFTVER